MLRHRLLTRIIAISKMPKVRAYRDGGLAPFIRRVVVPRVSQNHRKLALIADQEDVLISSANRRPALRREKRAILIRANVSIPATLRRDAKINKDMYMCNIIKRIIIIKLEYFFLLLEVISRENL